MQNAVQTPEFLVEQTGQFLEVLRAGHRQVHRCQSRLRAAGSLDLVVDLFQFLRGTPQQDHGGAVAGQGEGGAAADTGTGAGDQNDAVLEGIGGALIGQCFCIHGRKLAHAVLLVFIVCSRGSRSQPCSR